MTDKSKPHAAFIFPGQGAQEVGMGLDFYQRYPAVRELFNEADRFLDLPLSRICFDGPAEEVNSDITAQLAVYTLSCAIHRVLAEQGIHPAFLAGYSSGFYAAAYAAGCYDFFEGLNLVRRAGEILIEEGEKIQGGMAVIFGLSAAEVQDICRVAGDVEVAIVNTPRQILISGLKPSLERACGLARERGALDTYPLAVGTAYHSIFMGSGADRLRKESAGHRWASPRLPLFSYHIVDPVSSGEDLRETILSQLTHPVRWVDLIRTIRQEGAELFIEVGPGTVLTRTLIWIERSIPACNTSSADKLSLAVNRFHGYPAS